MIPEFLGKEFNNDIRVSIVFALYSQVDKVKQPMRQITLHISLIYMIFMGAFLFVVKAFPSTHI